jgi:hypothetical protein
MRGLEQLTTDNHTLYRRVQHLVRLNWSWEAIALDVGVYQVNDLCQWVLDYREPKRLPMVNSQVLNVPVRSQELVERGVRLQTWRRQRNGARAALEAMGQ